MIDATTPILLDLHSHLIPGVDDGCRTLDDTLACIRRLQEAGFGGSVCTPHVWPELYPANTRQSIRQWVDVLRENVAGAGLDYKLWAGGEVRIAPGMSEWLSRNGVPTLGESRCVLIDYWGGDWPHFADELIDWLLAEDFRPILAHPERMGLDDDELEELADSLARRGAWLQCNLRSLAGGEGLQARRQVEALLDRGRVHALATDAHSPADLDGRLAGIGILERIQPSKADDLLARRPGEILGKASLARYAS